ncbi:MAG: DNA/RNA endonuclease [Bacteroidia bacterium]|nr:MAG: DNA/RNA endonuclease [Bacteroidia bacterium]
MNLLRSLLLFVFLSAFFLWACKKEKALVIPEDLEFPAAVKDHPIVRHSAYALSYNEKHEQADWVAYHLTKAHVLDKSYKRSGDFRPDEKIATQSAQLSDYKPTEKIYARGHLAPAGDFRWSKEAMSESFLMSNMSPMRHRFNGGKWLYLEKEVRHWAEIYGDVYVATGPVLEDGLESIGNNKVSVPKKFFKVIMDVNHEKAIGFIIPQDTKVSFKNYAVPVDEVEKITGLDFFHALDNDREEKMESRLNLSQWEFAYY